MLMIFEKIVSIVTQVEIRSLCGPTPSLAAIFDRDARYDQKEALERA